MMLSLQSLLIFAEQMFHPIKTATLMQRQHHHYQGKQHYRQRHQHQNWDDLTIEEGKNIDNSATDWSGAKKMIHENTRLIY